jgi:hypothetical protein
MSELRDLYVTDIDVDEHGEVVSTTRKVLTDILGAVAFRGGWLATTPTCMKWVDSDGTVRVVNMGPTQDVT